VDIISRPLGAVGIVCQDMSFIGPEILPGRRIAEPVTGAIAARIFDCFQVFWQDAKPHAGLNHRRQRFTQHQKALKGAK
jgi:hypothetical protein